MFIPSTAAVIMLTGYAIASVYVRPHLRKNGYGRHLLRLMHHVLAPPLSLPAFPKAWGSPPLEYYGDAVVSILYSDVGEFYTTCGPSVGGEGWVVADKRSTIWSTEGNRLPSASDDVQLLDEAQLKELLVHDEELLLKELCHASRPEQKRFTFLPLDGPLNFQIQRFKLTPTTAPPNAKAWPPTKFGAHLNTPFSSNLVFAAWTFEPKHVSTPSKLIITRMRCDGTSMGKLMNAALDVAVEAGVEQVEVWNLSGELVRAAAEIGGKTIEREDHWPSIAWYGSPGDDVEWVNNEK